MPASRKHPALAIVAAVLACSCGGGGGHDEDAAVDTGVPDTQDDTAEVQPDTAGDPDATTDEAGLDPDAEPDEDAAGDPDADPDEEEALPPRVVTCADEPPPGSDLPDPLPVYAGTCPTLVSGVNTITSSGAPRTFILAFPSDLDPSERLPVAFLWHWLGGDAQGFIDTGEVQPAVDEMRFLAVAPESKDDVLMKWPFLLSDSAARMEEEAVFFDDMLACVADQFNVNENCVSSVGVSAGALWTDQLTQLRSRRLSSFLSLSGGVGVSGDWLNPVKPWTGAAHRLPAIVLWGGPTDFCGLTFATTSGYLEDALVAGNHFIVECIHNCAHAEPPMEPLPGESKYGMLWSFIYDHPYWLRDGESPYQATGLPSAFPEWCGIGPGSATIRSGECTSGPLGECF